MTSRTLRLRAWASQAKHPANVTRVLLPHSNICLVRVSGFIRVGSFNAAVVQQRLKVFRTHVFLGASQDFG